MEEILTKSTVGTGGFLATIGLSAINEIVSIAVGLATLCYLSVAIYKALK